jgi:hypothetical protein
MTRRDRTAQKLVIGADKPFSYRETSLEYWRSRISSSDISFADFCSKTEHKLALEFNNFHQWLAISLEVAGFEISNMGGVPNQSITEDVKITKYLLSFAEKQKVIEMLGLDRRLDTPPYLSDEGGMEPRVAEFMHCTKMPLGCMRSSDVDFIFSSGWRDKICNAAAWLLNDEEFHYFVQQVVETEWGSKK